MARLKLGMIVTDGIRFYLFLKTEGRNVHLLSLNEDGSVDSLIKLKRRDIEIAKEFPDNIQKYSIA